MVAALKYDRNSIGVEIDPEYCRIAASYLKAESCNLFSDVEIAFEKAISEKTAFMVKEDAVLYQVRPARRRLG